VRSLFALAVEELRELCIRANAKELFVCSKPTISRTTKNFLRAASNEYGIPLTDVTNALAWARREFSKNCAGAPA